MNKPLAEEQFVTAEDLMDPKSGSLDTLLPQGMRAIAVKVNAASSVSGFVQPNCRVDVVSTVRQGDESFSQIILQNMLVLAADMQSQRDPEKQASISSTVTMAAKPEDAQKLRLAEAMGELSLILRGAEDDQNLRVKPIKPRDVVRSTDGSVEAATGEEPAAVGGAAPPLIGVPDVPTPTKPTETAAAPDKAPPPTPAPAPRTVAQVIYNGETVTKTVFILNDDGNVVTRVEKTGMEREPRPEKKEKEPGKSEKDKSEPEAKKDGDKKEGDKEPAAKTDGTK
jgi:Flp pilus assembly protein CpaB